MTKNSIFLMVLFFQFSLNAQMMPCEGGTAGPYSCNDYDFMSRTPIDVLSGLPSSNSDAQTSDIWGWTDSTTNKEYALVCMRRSTAFVDITDPVNPLFLGRLNSTVSSTNVWRDVKIYNDYAFIVADGVGAHGMQVFDLTRLRGVTSPQTFTVDALYTGVRSCHNIVINESEAVAYLVACNTFGGGPTFVDISDPLNPTSLGGYSSGGRSHDAQVVTYNGPDSDYAGREIYIGSNESRNVVIMDVTDKNNVSIISQIDYAQIRYAHQGWFTEDQRYFILGDELDETSFGFNTKTLVFDFSNLDNPTLSSTYFGSTKAIDHNGYVKGNEYFLANYRAGLRVLNIDNIASPTNSMTEVGFFDTYPGSNGASFNGAWSIYPYFPSGNIIISDIERGLIVVRKSNTLSTPDVSTNQVFTVAPNPTTFNTTIKASEGNKVESIQLFNTLGQRIFNKENMNSDNFVLPMHNYSKGLYLIKINNTVVKKLVLK